MKSIIKLLLAITLITGAAGCKTTPDQCAKYQAIYAAYQASAAVREPSESEIAIAAAAASYLQITCGWVSVRGSNVDVYGVPVLAPPH